MTDRRAKECIIFNPETGISEDGTMHDGVYRQWINQPKKERKMTREEAIEVIRSNRLFYRDWKQEKFDEAVERLEQPPTLAEILGWNEGQEYKWRGVKYRIFYDILQYFDEDEHVWWDSIEELNDYLKLRQAKKVDTMGIKDSLLDELQELVTSKRINEIIEQLRGLNND